MNSTASKIIAVLLSLFMIAYVGYQAYNAFYNPYVTEVVKKSDYVQDIDLNGFFVRPEKVIDAKREGITRYHYKNAQKISKDAVIADVYEKESDLYTLRKIESLEEQRAILKESQNQETNEGLKLDLLSKQINTEKNDLVKCVDESDFSNLDSIYSGLLLNMNQFANCVDNTLSYDSTIVSFQQQIDALSAEVPSVTKKISSSDSGYFSNTVDGMEMVFTPEMLENLTVSEVAAALEKQSVSSDNDNIGKVATDETWSFVSLITAKEAELFKVGQQIKLKFNSRSTREVTAKVSQLIIEKENDQAAVVFESGYLDEDFVSMRFEKPKAIIGTYTGIVIPKEAIRIGTTQDSDGNDVEVKGVYTLLGKTVRFRQVDILYEDAYVLISKPNTSTQYVSIYDQVITKGKNLHEMD